MVAAALVKALEYVGLRYAVDALITNSADNRTFLYPEDNDFCRGVSRRILDNKLDVLKVRSVPERLKVTP
jgi:hypothetical protein